VAGAFGVHRARLATLAGVDAGARAWLLVAAASGLFCSAASLSLPLTAAASPQAHAHVALSAMLAGYVSLHAFLGGVFAVHVFFRCRAGYVSPMRSLDVRILWQWWIYTAVGGLLVFALLQLVPLALS
jgi:cytochrome c oxidase subunit I+III